MYVSLVLFSLFNMISAFTKKKTAVWTSSPFGCMWYYLYGQGSNIRGQQIFIVWISQTI